jgi:outer membrane protein TolC
VILLVLLSGAPLHGQERGAVVELTMERMVELALSTSYRVRQLNLSIDRTRHYLQAQEARLKSRVDLEFSAPEFRAISDTEWNSDLQRDEIVHENTRRWEAELSVRQPVILFGVPTNGYLSLNNRMYRYTQRDEDGDRDIRYYNRYFVRYTQPLFQPNNLKNNLEEAELDLEDAELNFQEDVVGLVDDLSDDYFELFDDAYQRVINTDHVYNLEVAMDVAREAALVDSTRTIEEDQIRVELANAREQLQRAHSEFRLQAARIKQRLQIPESDSIVLDPVLDLRPVTIDVDEAVRHAMALTPRLRQLDISYRENEINLEETKGRNSFRMDLAFSYGREMADPVFQDMWGQPSNTYTVDVNAYLPIWDWGERNQRIAASEISLEQTALRIEEAETQIFSNVLNEVRNVEEYETRALAMEENLDLASDVSQESLTRYQEGTITVLELIQSLRRELDTANNFLDAYLGWRGALLRLQELTFYDFERGMPVVQRFGIVMSRANPQRP